MGTLVATYSERDSRFYKIAGKFELKPEGVRKIRASPLRYCLGDNYLYLPSDCSDESFGGICWARISGSLLNTCAFDFGDHVEGLGEKITGLSALEHAGVRIGDRYLRRAREENGKFVSVPKFCSQELVDSIVENPDSLSAFDSDDFENLCAEVFARRGFKVDLFRKTKDGGIDFLAVQDEQTDPMIFAVQVKQPENRPNKPRRSVGRPVVQQIYGAAKAWNLHGAMVISGSTYSPEAKAFSELKTEEIKVYDSGDILNWLMQYRWNEDELR